MKIISKPKQVKRLLASTGGDLFVIAAQIAVQGT
jgi:hypothetical protein